MNPALILSLLALVGISGTLAPVEQDPSPDTSFPCLDTKVLCCNDHIDSHPGDVTRWTDPVGPGNTGYNQPSVAADAYSNGLSTSGQADNIWKSTSYVGGADPTNPGFGVEFVASFVSCNVADTLLHLGTLRVIGDDAYQAYFNNELVGFCGVPGKSVVNCIGDGSTVPDTQKHVVHILPYPLANTIRIHVWNQPGDASWNKASLAYRLDY